MNYKLLIFLSIPLVGFAQNGLAQEKSTEEKNKKTVRQELAWLNNLTTEQVFAYHNNPPQSSIDRSSAQKRLFGEEISKTEANASKNSLACEKDSSNQRPAKRLKTIQTSDK